MLETSSSEQDRSLEILRAMFKRDKTDDNQTEEIEALLIRNRTTGWQAQVSYRDRVQEASVTRAAVCMGVKEKGMRTGHKGTYNQPLSQDREQVRMPALRDN